MSDQPPAVRRVSSRIVSPTTNGSPDVSGRRETPVKELPGRPAVRPRPFGAPLIGSSPVVRPGPARTGRLDRGEPVARLPDQGAGLAQAPTPEEAPAKADVGAWRMAPRETDYAVVPPVVFWDQPPRPDSEIDEKDLLPLWVEDVSLSPTEAQYTELGAYLAFMVDGFSDFCCSQPIVESGQWQGSMRMPQKILPETMLQLEVSPFHVLLRFETDHPVSREILQRHSDALRERVTAALQDARTVEVSIW